MEKVVYPELKKLRIESGATVADLENASGVSRKTIDRLESGKDLKAEKLFQIINGLNSLRDEAGLPFIEVKGFKKVNQ